MPFDRKTVLRTAELARLEIEETRIDKLAQEMDKILHFVEQLESVDTENTEPLRSVMPITREWREDKVNDGNKKEAVLSNAPKIHDGCFVVPKVVE